MLLKNLKTYWRFLGNNKLYTIVTIVGFAVSLMFVLLLSIYVKQELSVDQFHEKKERIYLLTKSKTEANFANPVAGYLKDNIPEIESFTRITCQTVTIDAKNGKITTDVLLADPDFFTIFSFPLLEGDPFTVFSAKNTAVITPSYARKLFQDENPIGKTIQILHTNGSYNTSITVTGVIADFPENTQIPKRDVIVNYGMLSKLYGYPDEFNFLEAWWSSGYSIYFLAKERTDLPSKAPLVVELLYEADYSDYVWDNREEAYFVPLTDVYFSNIEFYDIRTGSKTLVSIYLTIVFLILIVAILNYINLSVAQTGRRGRESAMKKLLGCSKRELITQFLFESTILTLLSFAIGIFLAFLAEPFFNDALNTKLNLGVQLTGVPYLFTILLFVGATGVISGWIPAIFMSRFHPIEVVKGSYMRIVKTFYSKVLIAFQYIVAMILLSCSIFVVKQTNYMRNYNMGYNCDNLLLMNNTVELERIPALRDILENITGIERVSFASDALPESGSNQTFQHHGQTLSFQEFYVDSAFFDILGIKIKSFTGVPFSKDAVFVNRKAYNALQFDTVSYVFEFRENYSLQIAGILSDFNFGSLHQDVGMLMIRSNENTNQFWMKSRIYVKISAAADRFKTKEEIKRVYSEFNGGIPFEMRFADDIVQQWYEKENKMAKLLSSFTVLTFVILLMGIFALSLYYVQQRKKEIAIRKVNGATELEIMRMLNYNFVRWILIAFVIAVPIAYYAVTRWLENFAYKTTLSWWVFALAGVVTLVLSVVSISVQSWQAATAKPIKSLKSE